MKLVLFSTDQSLKQLCRETLQSLGVERYNIVQCNRMKFPEKAEIYIADCSFNRFDPSAIRALPAETFERTLWILDRTTAEAFRAQVGRHAWILLKPVSAVALGAALERLVGTRDRSFVSVGRDDLMGRLTCANLQLQEHEHQRTAAVARAAHEFRSPLAALKWGCLLLSEGFLGTLNEAQTEAVMRMSRSASRMSKIALELDEIACIKGATRVEETEADELAECVKQAIHEARQKMDEKHIRIGTRLEPASGSLQADIFAIEQVLTNLMDNACRFVPRFGRIEIRSYMSPLNYRGNDDQSLWVEIQNNGPAIPEGFLERIFEESLSLPDSTGRTGRGFGLAICRSIVEGCGGAIWAENTARGPSFRFTLPIGQGNCFVGTEADPTAIAAVASHS